MKTGFASDFRTAIYAESFSHYSSISGIPPLILTNSKGLPLKSWSITGNTAGVGDYDSETGKYKISVAVRGKNLIEAYVRNATIDSKGVIASGGDYRLYIARVTPKTVYTIKASDIVSNTSYQVYAFFKDYPKANSVSYNQSRVVPPQYRDITVTTPDNVKYIAVRYLADDLTPQIECGSSATAYEPYREPVTYAIHLNSPLMAGDTLHSNGSIVRSDGTTEHTDVPKILTLQGNCVLSADTEIQPSNMRVKYKSGGR